MKLKTILERNPIIPAIKDKITLEKALDSNSEIVFIILANIVNIKEYCDKLKERADIFLNEAKEVNLDILPYKSGFFVTIPIGETVDKVIEELESQNIFVIKFDKGIRIGICSVPKRKIVGLAKKIKEAIEKSK